MDATQLAFEATPKALVYVAAVVAIGLAATRLLVARADELGTELDAIVRATLARLFAVAGALLLLGAVARLLGHTVAAFGPGEGLTLDALRTIGLESQWGRGWRLQALAAAAVLLAAPALGAAALPSWGVPGVAALAAGATIPLLGHGAESTGATLLHATHLVGSGLWLGTLMAMLVLERRILRGYGVTAAHRLAQALVPRFSPLAVFVSSVVIVSGVVAVLDYVPAPAALVETTYGRALTIKLLLVAVVGGCGFANWQAVLAGRPPTRRLMRLEALAALAIVLVTAVLTESEPPPRP